MNKKTRSTKSEKRRHACNSVEIAWTNEQKVAVTSYGRNKNHDEIKKHSRTSPDVQFKEFSLTLQTTRPRADNEWIGKTISKKIRWKNEEKTENQCQNAAREIKKPLVF